MLWLFVLKKKGKGLLTFILIAAAAGSCLGDGNFCKSRGKGTGRKDSRGNKENMGQW